MEQVEAPDLARPVNHIAQARHVLVLPSSATKSESENPMPAFQRYRGPLQLQLACRPPVETSVYFLSACFGRVNARHPIVAYNQKMTEERAAELEAECSLWRRNVFRRFLEGDVRKSNYGATFLAAPAPQGPAEGELVAILPRLYAQVFVAHLPEAWRERFTVLSGSILQMRAHLTGFLDAHAERRGAQ
jgi:hypothetical protein